MQGQISRWSHDPRQPYTGLYHVQGGMITDADLNRSTELSKRQLVGLGADAIRDGAPMLGGVVDVSGAAPALRPGIVYADGMRGELRVRAGGGTVYANQADLEAPTAIPGAGEFVLYADIWERPVFHLEDPLLTDPGLHGAQTAFASRTMTQIKWAPGADLAALEAGTGNYPRKGDYLLDQAALVNTAALPDPCDPCAEEVKISAEVGNTLFRLEVMGIEGSPSAPTAITFAWSSEGAAEIAAANPVPAPSFFARGVFEYVTPASEGRKGVGPAAWPAAQFWRPDPNVPAPAGAQFIRRWDDFIRVPMGAAGTTTTPGGGKVILSGNRVLEFQTGLLNLRLQGAGKPVLVGDYWLVEMRRFAANKVRIVSPQPIGVDHHIAVLFKINNGAPVALDDAARRKLTFPTISDIPADHVSLDNTCPKLFGDAKNVQQALSNLCSIEARDIAFTDNCPDLFAGATDVQAALDKLCGIDRNGIDLKLFFDWGVLCSLRVDAPTGGGARDRISVSGGYFLDAAGAVGHVGKAAVIDVNTRKVMVDGVAVGDVTFEPPFTGNDPLDYCVQVARGQNQEILYRLAAANAARPSWDRTYAEAVEACKKRPTKLWEMVAENQQVKENLAVKKAMMSASTVSLGGVAPRMKAGEATEVAKVTKVFLDALKESASPEIMKRVEAGHAQADVEFSTAGLAGEAAESKRGLNAVAKLKTVFWGGLQAEKECECIHAYPPCPDPGAGPHWVALACVQIFREGSKLEVGVVCEFCCRRQALTPRTLRYWGLPSTDNLMKGWKDRCCGFKPGIIVDPADIPPWEEWPPRGNIGPWPPEWPGFDPRIDPRVLDPGNIDPVRPDMSGPTWTSRPPIHDLGVDVAANVLKGHGLEVIEELDLDAPDTLDILVDKGASIGVGQRLFGAEDVRPGDRVAMLKRDGKAQGYVVLERGGGRYLFDKGSNTEVADLKAGLDRLAGNRDGLTKDLRDLGAEVGKLAAEKARIETDLGAARKDWETQLSGLQDHRGELLGEISKARAEWSAEMVKLGAERARQIEDLGKARDKLVEDVKAVRDKADTDLRATRDKAEADLRAQRDKADAELKGLNARREEVADGVREMTSRLDALKAERAKVIDDVDSRRKELDQLQGRLVETWKEQPLTVLLADQPEVLKALALKNVTTVGGLADMKATDAAIVVPNNTALTRAHLRATNLTRIR